MQHNTDSTEQTVIAWVLYEVGLIIAGLSCMINTISTHCCYTFKSKAAKVNFHEQLYCLLHSKCLSPVAILFVMPLITTKKESF